MKHWPSIVAATFSVLCFYWLVAAIRRGSVDIGRGARILVFKASPWFWFWMGVYALVGGGTAFLAVMLEISN